MKLSLPTWPFAASHRIIKPSSFAQLAFTTLHTLTVAKTFSQSRKSREKSFSFAAFPLRRSSRGKQTAKINEVNFSLVARLERNENVCELIGINLDTRENVRRKINRNFVGSLLKIFCNHFCSQTNLFRASRTLEENFGSFLLVDIILTRKFRSRKTAKTLCNSHKQGAWSLYHWNIFYFLCSLLESWLKALTFFLAS